MPPPSIANSDGVDLENVNHSMFPTFGAPPIFLKQNLEAQDQIPEKTRLSGRKMDAEKRPPQES